MMLNRARPLSKLVPDTSYYHSEGLDKQLRTMRGSLKVAIAKRIDLEGRIEREERKIKEIQDPTYSDDQRNMIEDRMKKLRDELNERNKEMIF